MILRKCKGCGATIAWIRMHTGSMMPCNPDKKVFVHEGPAGGQIYKGYTPHWSTCQNASNFKKPKMEKKI